MNTNEIPKEVVQNEENLDNKLSLLEEPRAVDGLDEVEKKNILYKRWKEWEKLQSLVRSIISEGDFTTAIRIMEGYIEATKQFTGTDIRDISRISEVYSNGKFGVDGLAFCYEQLGDLEKASKRYEEIDAFIVGAQSYEKINNIEKARELLKKAIEVYSRSSFNNRLLRVAREELNRLELKDNSL